MTVTNRGTVFTCDAVPGWVSRGYDPDGVRWKMNGLTGWDEPPDARDAYVARSGSGMFDGPVYDDGRTISWTGTLQAPTRELREKAKITLARLARALREGAELVGHDDDGIDKSVRAKRAAGWKIAPRGPYGLVYQVTVRCPDPYKYGAPRSVSTPLPSPGTGGLHFPMFAGTGYADFGTPGEAGQLQLTNPGTENAWPTFQVTGPVLGGLTITDVATGREIYYSGDVPDGANLLIIDSAVGEAQLNGADRTSLLEITQWFPVPPGGTGSLDPLLIDDVWVITASDGRTVTLSSPDIVDQGDGSAELLVETADQPQLTVQFSTLGPTGQGGQLTATVQPTYQ